MFLGQENPRAAFTILGFLLFALGGFLILTASVIGWFVGPVLVGLGYGLFFGATHGRILLAVSVGFVALTATIATGLSDLGLVLAAPAIGIYGGFAASILFMRGPAQRSRLR
jgi:hypothetical protein